jgi:hypothetical protein
VVLDAGDRVTASSGPAPENGVSEQEQLNADLLDFLNA